MATHRIFVDTPLAGQRDLVIEGSEAQHALRVKRLGLGDPVEVLDGFGHIARCSIAETGKRGRDWTIRLTVQSITRAPPVRPRVEVLSAVPKGPRLTDMIDTLSQVGAASWSPLRSERSVGEPGRSGRLERAAAESAKQCGRAWRMEIGPPIDLAAAFSAGPVILADASGRPYVPTGSAIIRAAVGPEGGWTEQEIDLARRSGATITRFGHHTMRIETAAAAATAIILHQEALRSASGGGGVGESQ